LYKHAVGNHKPFSVPEWGIFTIDDPTFVKHMCTFLDTHRKTELAAFYESRPGSILDLGSKPKSRETYSQCITPLGGPLPSWAGATGATITALSLRPVPPSGTAPLTVRFLIAAKLSVPIEQWEVTFGDGATATGSGTPPPRLSHTYAANGEYQAMLFVFQGG